MRYVLFATPRFGAIALEKLVAQGLVPVALVTNPDRPVGRKQVVTPPPAKQKARELQLNIPIFQPEKLADIYDELRALNADCFIVAAYGKILRQELLDIPKRGVLGIHGSVLPKYRGASPMQQALIDGLSVTGVSLFVVDTDIDHGPVIADATYEISPEETYISLEEKLATLGADLTATSIQNWIEGKIEAREQDHSQATFTKKFAVPDGYVAWELVQSAYAGNVNDAHIIKQRIAGLTPEPGVWTERDGVRTKLLAAKLTDGKLLITRYKIAGKNETENLSV